MLASKALLLLGAAMAATAFTIPKGAADGFYTVHYDTDGNEVHTLIQAGDVAPNTSERSITPNIKIGKRGQTWCGCRYGMDHGTCDTANSRLGDILGNGYNINGNAASYYVQSPSVAFMCNKDGYQATVNRGMIGTGSQHVTNACGWYVAGTWRIDGLPAMDYGYMNWNDGLDFCHNAEISGAHSC